MSYFVEKSVRSPMYSYSPKQTLNKHQLPSFWGQNPSLCWRGWG